MDTNLSSDKWQCAIVYIEDVIIFFKSWEELVKHLEEIIGLGMKA